LEHTINEWTCEETPQISSYHPMISRGSGFLPIWAQRAR
jgi:hypothetical protein